MHFIIPSTKFVAGICSIRAAAGKMNLWSKGKLLRSPATCSSISYLALFRLFQNIPKFYRFPFIILLSLHPFAFSIALGQTYSSAQIF